MALINTLVRFGWKVLSRQKKLSYAASSLYSSIAYFLALPSFCFFMLKRRFAAKKRAGAPGVNMVGYFTMESGIGESARSLVSIVQKTTVPFSLKNLEDPLIASNDRRYSDLLQKDDRYDISIFDVNANRIPAVIKTLPANWMNGSYNIAYWVWELEAFPKQWLPSFACFDEIWSPSAFCTGAFQRKTSLPVMTMPYAINIENINALCSRKDFGLSPGGFVFLFVFSLQSAFERKNPLAVISAFKKAFRDVSRDKVCLALKISGAAQHRWAYDEINKASAGLPVTIIDAHLDAATLYRLMDLSDCYVSLHRSEGFGLTIAESMFLGKPCIATAYSGNMEFMNADNSYPVNYSLSKIAHSIGPYKKGNLWAEPDIEHAAELMRFVYEQRDEAAQKGSSGARQMRDKFSPQALSKVFERRLQAIRNGPSRNKP